MILYLKKTVSMKNNKVNLKKYCGTSRENVQVKVFIIYKYVIITFVHR